ncbi:MAG: S-layer homology domain-containing protein [Clostridia bacterium]|nr:S-layer homology domain-containing protein [Clostridia bacterium]
MRRKILALTIALAMLLTTPVFASSFTDVSDSANYAEAVNVLSSVGILSGMGDGGFYPENPLTRAQFAKIAVYATGQQKNAVSGSASAFTDVDETHWANKYISLVSEKEVITGYPDGSFAPEQEITYAQAVTILLRLLGYTGDDVGNRWPAGYLEKAESLGITEEISFSANASVSRGNAALMIYRTLFTKVKDTDSKLVSLTDLTLNENCIIIATQSENSALLPDEVSTSAGTFKKGDYIDAAELIGSQGSLLTDEDDKIVAFLPDEQTSENYIVNSSIAATNSTDVTIAYDGGEINIPNDTPVYSKGVKSSASELLADVAEGSTIQVFRSATGAMRYVFLNEYTMQGPKTITSDSVDVQLMFNISDMNTLKVIRKGITSSVEELKRFDVLYYSERTHTLYAYADRVTGVYEKASPIKANVKTVTVSGNTYTLATQSAVNKMNESAGAFAIDDTVTLLMGKDGDVVDVVDLNSSDISTYGVVLQGYTKVSEDEETKGRNEYYVKLCMASGDTMDFKTDRDYSEWRGSFCTLSFENGFARIQTASNASVTGKIDVSAKTFGGVELAADYSILELLDADSNPAVVEKITLNDIANKSISSAKVLHVERDSLSGAITVLYVKNVSKSQYSYGVVTSGGQTSGTLSSSYTLLVDGTEQTFAGTTFTGIYNGNVVAIYQNGGTVTEMFVADEVGSGTKINSYTDNRVTIGNVTYDMAIGVQVYAGRVYNEYKSITLEDASKLTATQFTLYADAPIENGGKVRVIIARTSV